MLSDARDMIAGSSKWIQIDYRARSGINGNGSSWAFSGVKAKDGDQWIGGKQKRWYIKAACVHSNGSTFIQDFQGSLGYDEKNEQVWNEVNSFIRAHNK